MENKPEPPPLKTRLRWYQYRLRTLLIIMTVFAAWMAMISHRARQQKQAVEKIRVLGGTVHYDYQKKYVNIGGQSLPAYDPQAIAPYPEFLRTFLGSEYFQKVVSIELGKSSVADDDLAILENLPDLESLALNETKITGKGLVHLEGLKNLVFLFLDNTLIDDNGLTHLKGLTALRGLDLNDTNITDAGTIYLQKMTNLEVWLFLDSTQITDESLKYFRNFKKLKTLIMTHTRVTEKGVNNLQTYLPKTQIFFHHPGCCLD